MSNEEIAKSLEASGFKKEEANFWYCPKYTKLVKLEKFNVEICFFFFKRDDEQHVATEEVSLCSKKSSRSSLLLAYGEARPLSEISSLEELVQPLMKQAFENLVGVLESMSSSALSGMV